ncbi:hypothetical protein EJ419_04800 [Alloscardovia theropitheci]|uniref:EfeO-type cupredoxin-like domain-containing protein n=1 Tax=Alloscardovia theropitheci TaxID=2496842 RepID=A0A4R0QQ08_9BIFI|nr:cupredoxin domain-containing protein [Alloscardovia theropitheci]TCD54354.1 hypothetical protein EJ419_04800 [Alloscardovia theropitheci]
MITNIVVVLVGIGLIAFIIWWFFANHEQDGTRATQMGNHQEIEVEVLGGYSPQTIVLEKGKPATIIFNRKDPSSCLDQVVLPDFGVQADLPLGEKYSIQIEPDKAGEFNYACGMNMMHGKIRVE